MPLVFNSKSGAGRETMRLEYGQILDLRDMMYSLEQELRQVSPSSTGAPVNFIPLSGSFPKEEILAMILQNAGCTHISFMTGWVPEGGEFPPGLFTLVVPMKDVVPGDLSSGTIIDELNTIYSSVCCQHPPLINV